jgi:hypothetical protein
MTDAGHRYQNIEKSLGIGSTFVLGKDTPESAYEYSSSLKTTTDKCRWTKLIPKKGPDYYRMIEHLRGIGIEELALTYKDLRTKVIDYGLNYYHVWIMNNMQGPRTICHPSIGSGHEGYLSTER